MTKQEAYEIMKQIIRTVRDKNTHEAIQVAIKALAWECAYEKMMNITIGNEDSREENGQS